MNPEITKIIDQYLQGELSADDKIVFEKRLAESDVLQKEFALQKTIYEAAKRASVRTQVQQTGKSYHFSKKMQMAGIAVAIIAVATALTLWATSAFQGNENKSEITAEIQSLISKLEKESPIDNLKSEFFTWNGLDSIVLSQKGVLLSIPENAFLLNGKPYLDQAVIQWQEALDGATMMKSGLSTMSGDRLLETQGMFSIQAFTPDGKKLDVNPKTGIYVQVPVDEYKKDMQLFEGKKNSDGIIDWQNPKPLLKIPVPVDMASLNFYPDGYEKELDQLKLRKDKKYRDSLYLSFDESINSPSIDEESEPRNSSVQNDWITESKNSQLDSIWYVQYPDNKEGFYLNSYDHISPPKVIAFWNPKFNNTNLATREFEKRMRSIHGTCNNKVLEAYTQNLNKSISEIDVKVAKMGYPEFENFAAEQLGAVNPDNPHLKNLKNFYEKAITQMQKEVHNNRAELIKQQQQWDKEITDERIKEQSRTTDRESKALDEEYNFNMKNVYKQLGRTIGFQVYGTSPIYNIDKYVIDATFGRATTTVTDPETGKKATITYNDFSFEVENADQYDQIYAYLFPLLLNSYQRISGTDGKLTSSNTLQFSYPLNGDIWYDLAVVGISEKGYFYFQKNAIKKGKSGKVTLKHISETKLNASIEQLNSDRFPQPMQIKDELNWLIKEQQNYKEQKLRQDQAVFRNRIKKIIFPCFECDCED